MATGSSFLRVISNRPKLLAALTSRQFSTTVILSGDAKKEFEIGQRPAYHPGILGWIFIQPFRGKDNPDYNHGLVSHLQNHEKVTFVPAQARVNFTWANALIEV